MILINCFISFFLVNLATVSSILLIISKNQFDFTDLLYCFQVYNFSYLYFNFDYFFFLDLSLNCFPLLGTISLLIL